MMEQEEASGGDREREKKEEQEGYDFRLFFTKPSLSSAAAGRVVLRSPSPTAAHNGDGSRRGRPDAFYFAGVTGPELAAQYAQAAVSGSDIVAGCGVKWVRLTFFLSFFLFYFSTEGEGYTAKLIHTSILGRDSSDRHGTALARRHRARDVDDGKRTGRAVTSAREGEEKEGRQEEARRFEAEGRSGSEGGGGGEGEKDEEE